MDTKEELLKRIGDILENPSAEKVGDLTELETTDKTNLVAAINEVVGYFDDQAEAQGDLTELETTAKNSIVAAINELVARIEALEPTE